MPYNGPNDKKLPKNVRLLAIEDRKRWVDTWNSVFEQCSLKNEEDCEARAFAVANSAIEEVGGPGSGNWGHRSQKGQRGGSLPGSSGLSKSVRLSRHAYERMQERRKYQSVQATLDRLQEADVPDDDWYVEMRRQGKVDGYMVGVDGVVKTVLGSWYNPQKLSADKTQVYVEAARRGPQRPQLEKSLRWHLDNMTDEIAAKHSEIVGIEPTLRAKEFVEQFEDRTWKGLIGMIVARSEVELAEGGPGSGNWGHAGVKGTRGGSAPKAGVGAAMSLKTGKTAAARQASKVARSKPLTHGIEGVIKQYNDTRKRVEDLNARLKASTDEDERSGILRGLNIEAGYLEKLETELDVKVWRHIDAAMNGGSAPPEVVKLEQLKPALDGQVDFGVDAFSKMVDPGYGIDKMRINVAEDVKDGRSWFSSTENAMVIANSWRASASTVHEMGHWLEHNFPAINQAALQFRARRASGERPQQIYKDIKDEIGFFDKFVDPYIGKIYPGRQNGIIPTELISVGMELMFMKPGRLVARDPEYAEFIFAIMQGKGYL